MRKIYTALIVLTMAGCSTLTGQDIYNIEALKVVERQEETKAHKEEMAECKGLSDVGQVACVVAAKMVRQAYYLTRRDNSPYDYAIAVDKAKYSMVTDMLGTVMRGATAITGIAVGGNYLYKASRPGAPTIVQQPPPLVVRPEVYTIGGAP